jgi:hypothetical protein
MNAERTGRVTRCSDDASRGGSTDGHRFARKAWVCQDGSRSEHRIDISEQDLARPASHRTSSQVTGHSVNRFEVTQSSRLKVEDPGYDLMTVRLSDFLARFLD